MYHPEPLKKGDLLRVIAPCGAMRSESVSEGLAVWLKHGYQVELHPNCYLSDGYLAGNDIQRRQALSEAWLDPQCKGIICLRGGYGGARLLEDWQWKEGINKWLIGFSDVTALLWSLAKHNISGIHGPVLTTIAKEPEWSIKRLFTCLEGGRLEPIIGTPWGGGKATGVLLPANLTVATHLLGTKIQPSFDGVILALEDVTEAPYRIDRMLTQWRMMGAFEGVRGIALGRFSRCHAPSDISSWSVEAVLRDRLGDLGIPIVSDLPFGHDGANAALKVGQLVELDADEGILHFDESRPLSY